MFLVCRTFWSQCRTSDSWTCHIPATIIPLWRLVFRAQLVQPVLHGSWWVLLLTSRMPIGKLRNISIPQHKGCIWKHKIRLALVCLNKKINLDVQLCSGNGRTLTFIFCVNEIGIFWFTSTCFKNVLLGWYILRILQWSLFIFRSFGLFP